MKLRAPHAGAAQRRDSRQLGPRHAAGAGAGAGARGGLAGFGSRKASTRSLKASLSNADRRFESWREVSQIPEVFESLGVKPRPPNTRAWRKTHHSLTNDAALQDDLASQASSTADKADQNNRITGSPSARTMRSSISKKSNNASMSPRCAASASTPRLYEKKPEPARLPVRAASAGSSRKRGEVQPKTWHGSAASSMARTNDKYLATHNLSKSKTLRSKVNRELMSSVKASVFDPSVPVDLKVKGQGASGESWPSSRSGEELLREPSRRGSVQDRHNQYLPSSRIVESNFPPVHVRKQPNLPPGAFRRRVGEARCFGLDRESHGHLEVVRRIGDLRRHPRPPADPRILRRPRPNDA